MEGESVISKLGGRKVIHSQAREVIANVYRFMKREAEMRAPINVNKIQERVCDATGVSVRTLRRIVKEEKQCIQSESSFSTPNKKRFRKKPKTDIDDFDLCVIRRTINEFHRTEGERPTVKSLLVLLKEKIDFKGGKWALTRILKKLGFRWKQSINNRKVLVEESDVREMRLKYLKNLIECRKQNRPIIYMDETYVHSTQSKKKAWTDASGSGLKTPVTKGQRLIIVHAGSEDGFVKDALLTFKSGRTTGDYHHDMNYENYEKWVKNKLIPNLPPNSVIVIDNAPYHNVQLNPAPTSSSRKADMIKWLEERNIPHSSSMLKPELYSIIKIYKPNYKMYKIDAIFAESGHSVSRLPPYHPDLNPIELIWSLIKGNVAKKNITFNIDNVASLVMETCNSITAEDWKKRCDHCKKIEQEYIDLEPHIDDITEQLIIRLGDDSDSEESGEDMDNNTSDCEDDELDLRGIEPLNS